MTRPFGSRLVRRLLGLLLVFVAIEGLLRLGFAIREARVSEIPLPYVISDATGPVAPWIVRLRILEPDPVLVWKNKPSVHRRYLDLFTPTRREEDRVT